MRGRQLTSQASYGVEKIGSSARQYGAGNDKCYKSVITNLLNPLDLVFSRVAEIIGEAK